LAQTKAACWVCHWADWWAAETVARWELLKVGGWAGPMDGWMALRWAESTGVRTAAPKVAQRVLTTAIH